MLNEFLQAQIDRFQIGEMTEPTTILEGVGVYKLDERIPSKLREFADVEQRAMDLLERERIEQAWKGTISNLRAAAKIEILGPAADKRGITPSKMLPPSRRLELKSRRAAVNRMCYWSREKPAAKKE